MGNLLEGIKKQIEKFKGLSKGIKIASIATVITVIIAIVSIFFYSSANKYAILFSGLDSADSQAIIAKLKESSVDYKVEDEAILVPKAQVDELRLELASNLTLGSTGYELMDSGSSFGMTDEEFAIKKLRMQQGELEKTIKSFSQVADARVHITQGTDSVFASEKEEGSAAVYLKLASGAKLTADQVKSIVALVAGSSSGISEENVQVMDSNMNLLSGDIYGNDSTAISSDSVSSQMELEQKYEAQLQKTLLQLLTPVLGTNKVNVVVNADLDFDSKRQTQTVIDPNKVIVSQNTSRNESNSSAGDVSGSPIDESMGNTIVSSDENSTTVSEEQTTNYEVGKTETTVISAPGEVKKISASVIVDGEIKEEVRSAIENAVVAAIGLDSTRGDQISVIGMAYNESNTNTTNIDPFAEEESSNNKYIYGGIAAAVLALLGFIFFRRKKKKEDDEEVENVLDVVIDDKISKTPIEPLKPIEFEVTTEQQHVESEIKKYASEKPEQVADIVKSWLAESER